MAVFALPDDLMDGNGGGGNAVDGPVWPQAPADSKALAIVNQCSVKISKEEMEAAFREIGHIDENSDQAKTNNSVIFLNFIFQGVYYVLYYF